MVPCGSASKIVALRLREGEAAVPCNSAKANLNACVKTLPCGAARAKLTKKAATCGSARAKLTKKQKRRPAVPQGEAKQIVPRGSARTKLIIVALRFCEGKANENNGVLLDARAKGEANSGALRFREGELDMENRKRSPAVPRLVHIEQREWSHAVPRGPCNMEKQRGCPAVPRGRR